MEILDEQMHVRLVLSGRRQTVHVNLGELYTIGRVGAATSEARRLYRISAGDLQPTDALFDAINRGDIAAARDALNRGADLNGVPVERRL